MLSDSRYIFVEGASSTRATVRPHNWAERFAGNLASYSADRRLRYSPVLEPVVIQGTKYLRMCRTLEASNPALFGDVLGFAAHYDLPVHGLSRDAEPAPVLDGPEGYAKAS